MSNDGVNAGRRRFLVAATSVVGAAGAVGAAVPFVGSWFPSAKAKAAGAPVKVNIGKIEPGQQMVAEWRGQPVFIVRRTEETLTNLDKLTDTVADPKSEASVQPAYVEGAAADLGADWLGGYFCPCHGSKYDMAGRVYKGQPAPLNLPVPPHSYETDSVVIIGVDQESA